MFYLNKKKNKVLAKALNDPEEFAAFHQVLLGASDAIIISDESGKIIFVNKAAEKLVGYSKEELISQPLTRIMPDRFHNSHIGGFNRYLSSKVKTRDWSAMEVMLLHKDGHEIHAEISMSCVQNKNKLYITGIFRDIDSRKIKEAFIHENERRFRSLIERRLDVFCLSDTSGNILYMSPSVSTMLGYDPSELIGKDAISFFHPNDQLIAMELLARLIEDPSFSPKAQLRLRAQNGDYHWVEIESQNCLNDKSINALVSVFRDITDVKQAHEDLDRFFNLSRDLFCTLTKDGRFEKINPAFSHILGYRPEELKDKNILDLIHPDDLPTVENALQLLGSGEGFVSYDCRIACADGKYRWLAWNTSAANYNGNIYAVARDVTLSKKYENELKEKSEQYQLLFYDNPVPMFIYDTGTLEILSANNVAVEKYGYSVEEFRELKFSDLLPPHLRPAMTSLLAQAIINPTVQLSNWQHLRKDGSVIDVEVTSHAIQFKGRSARLISAFDITARRQAELARQQSEANLFAILENTDEAIWSIDMHFNLMTANTAFRKIFRDIFGFPVEELGQNQDKLSNSMKELFYDQFNQAMEGKRIIVERSVNVKGKKKNFEIHINPVLSKDKTIGISCFAREITERKRLEEALHNIATGISSATGEEFFRSLVNYLSKQLNADFVMVGELTGENKDWVRTIATSHLGESAENMEYPLANAPCEDVVAHGTRTFNEGVSDLFPMDSFLKQMEIESYVGMPLYDTHQECIGILIMMHRSPMSNIRLVEYIMQIFASRAAAELERKRAEEDVRQSEANLKALIENAQEAIWAVDRDYRLIIANEAFQKLFSYYYDVIPEKGTRLIEHFSEKAKEAWLQRFNRAANGERFILERHYDFGEEFMDTEVSINPIIRENGQITGVSYFSRDITHRKLAEEVIRSSEEKYRTLVETMKEGVMYVDSNEIIQFVNQQFCEMLGFTEEELLGQTCDIFLKDDETVNRVNEHMELRRQGYSSHYEALFVKKDQSSFWVLVNGTPMMTDEGEYLGAMATVTDISDLKKTEDDLKSINQDLNTFIYKSSHDLKGPLSSIMGLTQLATKEIKDKTALMYIDMIRQGASRLDNILSDLLDTIKIKEGVIQSEEIDFNGVLNDIIQSLSHSPGYAQIEYKINVKLNGPFHTDRNILRSILQNLIDNAIKYQDNNKTNPYIWVNVTEEEKGIKIEVEDNGLGILKAAQDKIFNMFFRAHLNSKGTGLGLYIVKNAVNKLGGTISFNSEEGLGTTFTLHLPDKVADTPTKVNEQQTLN